MERYLWNPCRTLKACLVDEQLPADSEGAGGGVGAPADEIGVVECGAAPTTGCN
jgi:hypothetical protein